MNSNKITINFGKPIPHSNLPNPKRLVTIKIAPTINETTNAIKKQTNPDTRIPPININRTYR